MMDVNDVDFGKLKEACKALNDAEGLLAAGDLENIKTVAVKKSLLMENFINAIEVLADKGQDENLPEEAILMYNELIAEPEEGADDEGGEDDAEDKGKDKKGGKAKAKGKDKEKKKAKPKPKSCYGHIASAMSGKLDEALKEGGTYEELMEALDCSRARINSHIKALRNKGLTPVVKDNKDWKKTHVKIKEKALA